MRQPFLCLATAILMALALAGCGQSLRYKLTLAVDTPDGIKRGSNVVEWDYWNVVIPARGTMHKIRGEALYLDLGPGKRPHRFADGPPSPERRWNYLGLAGR